MPQYHHTCLQCSKPFITRRNYSKYCSYECHKLSLRDRVIVNCLNCNKEISVKSKIAKDRKFCSRKCRSLFANKTFICEHCNKPFQSKIKNFIPKFCSLICRAKAREWNGPPRHYSQNWKTCPICGHQGWRQGNYCQKHRPYPSHTRKIAPYIWNEERTEFLKQNYPIMGGKEVANILGLKPSQVIGKANNIGLKLSKESAHRIIHSQAQKYMKSSKNPNWQGGIAYQEWGDNWPEQRKKALKRDNYTCQNCFNPGRTVHHIKRRRFFENIEDSNVLSNLITLCNKCHVPIELGKIPCPIPSF